jgi:hypothetical protein
VLDSVPLDLGGERIKPLNWNYSGLRREVFCSCFISVYGRCSDSTAMPF